MNQDMAGSNATQRFGYERQKMRLTLPIVMLNVTFPKKNAVTGTTILCLSRSNVVILLYISNRLPFL